MEYLLAIDVGSTTTRCILFDPQGMPVAEAYREPPVHHPQPTWTEVDAEDWWAAVVTVLREVLERVPGARERIRGVGLCGLMHALVPLDVQGKALARAMLWMDRRCQPQAEWLSRECGDLIEQSIGGGRGVSTTPSAPKLRWIVEHEPDLLRRTHVLLLAKDFIRYRLTGTTGTDPSDAGGTRLYDPRRGDWADELLACIGVPREKMPLIYPSTHMAGGVTKEAAALTGLMPGTPVAVGGGDVYCTLLGARHADAGWHSCLYLGTAAWMSVVLHLPAGNQQPSLVERFGATSTTGAAVKWLRRLLDGEQPDPAVAYAALLQKAGTVPIGSRGLICIPHLMGERGPRDNPQARGTLFGLTLAHSRKEIARAVLEGCAYQLRSIAEALSLSGSGTQRIEDMVVVGGGAKSELWLAIMADVMGMPLLVPRVVEAGALGAAITAGVGVGLYPNLQEAAQILAHIERRIEPDPDRQEQYNRLYTLFLELEERVAPLYARIAAER